MNIKQSVVILSNSVLVILPVVFLLASCASGFSHMFASSLYGQELESAMTACMDDVKSGLIDGVAKEDFKNIEFRSDEIEFSQRNNVSYPLTINCIIDHKAGLKIVAYNKQLEHGDWQRQ